MPEQHAAHAHATKDLSKLYVPAAIVIAGVIIAGAVFFTRGSSGGAAAGGDQPKVAVDIKKIKTDGQPFIGKADAPVTMAYWADYQCPFCKKFDEEVMIQIIAKYVDAGKLKVVYKDFVFLGNDSVDGALYEHAVWELYPTQFAAWHTDMYKNQDEEGDQGFGDAASIEKMIKQDFAGKMDVAKIRVLVAQKHDEYMKEIQADTQEGAANGINGTPGFITGKSELVGYNPFPAFQKVIDDQSKWF